MDEEQLWTGYYMAALAGGSRDPLRAANNAVNDHLHRWPNGRIAQEREYRAKS